MIKHWNLQKELLRSGCHGCQFQSQSFWSFFNLFSRKHDGGKESINRTAIMSFIYFILFFLDASFTVNFYVNKCLAYKIRNMNHQIYRLTLRVWVVLLSNHPFLLNFWLRPRHDVYRSVTGIVKTPNKSLTCIITLGLD